jgi:restriction endonuclease S subunit
VAQFVLHPPEYPRNYSDDGLQLIRSQNVRSTGVDIGAKPVFLSADSLIGKRIIKPKIDDVLIVRSGVNAGDIAAVDKDYNNCVIGADTLLARFGGEVMPKFIQVFFATNIGKFLLSRHITGATNTHLSPHSFNKAEIATLPIPEQNLAIKKFSSALNKREVMERQAQGILDTVDKYLFERLGINLNPLPDNGVAGLIFRSRRSEVICTRLDPFFHQDYFNRLFEGEAKYPFYKLGAFICEISYGASLNNDYVDAGIPLLRIKDLRRNEIVLEKVVYLPEQSRSALGNSFVKENDFLITRSGTIGVVALVDESVNGFAYGSFMIRFNLKQTHKINRKFLLYFLNSNYVIQFLKRNKIGAIQGNITIPTIKRIPICVPEIEVQNEIAEEISLIILKAKELQTLALKEFDESMREIEQTLLNDDSQV